MASTPTLTVPDEPVHEADFGMREALGHDVLTREEQIDLAIRIEAGLYAAHLLETGAATDATEDELRWLVTDGEAARQLFIESNLRLALSTSRKFRHRGISEDDVVQDAYHGLVKAVDKFDHTKGFMFSTYAVWWIRESIHTGIRQAQFVKHPEIRFHQITKVAAVRTRLLDQIGRLPTPSEIVAEIDRQRETTPGKRSARITEADVVRCLNEMVSVTSLQVPIGEDLTLGELISDEDATSALVAVERFEDRRLLISALGDALGQLPETDAAILRARFGLDGKPPRSVNRVSEELSLSRQTVRNHEQRALRRLKHPAYRQILDEFRPSA